MTSKAQEIELDNVLVAPENHRVIGKYNMMINPGMKLKEPTYQVVLDAFALTTCYLAFLITAEVPVIYNAFVRGKAFDEPPTEEEALSFIRELGHTGEIKYITDVIIDHHTNRGEPLHQSSTNVSVERTRLNQLITKISKTQDKMSIIGAERPKSRKSQKKSELVISFEEYPSKKKPAKAKKDVAIKPKLTKKKAPVKADRGKGLNVLTDVALSKLHTQGGVPDEQHHKTTGTDKGTGAKLGVPDVPKYESNSEQKSWGDSDKEDNDDEDNSSDDGDNDDDDGNEDAGDNNDGKDDDEASNKRTESDKEEIHDLNQSNEEREQEEEDVDERVHTPNDYELT
ncbi:hypothetical protein Tco_0205709 [Tanacetum coccineum]